ncbi:hypothetical protein [Streptomyces sp. W4I9-2]|uniref:hypothetical protein n=1 Tax=Streptomyces sp. W4I9-2 TaxID=3042297 RepID=UPI0027809758|nr:hypothetical protein [Streptomyces sp. W4I9-2]MDQ0694272.1 hypothetical protein [Streptomyces sp. W4I9-2]
MPTTPDRPAESILGPITPIRCNVVGCHWACHGVPDKYADSRARIVREHMAAEHTPTPEAPDCPTDQLRAAAELLRDKATAAIHEGRTTWSIGHTLGSKSPVVVDDPDQPSVLIETYAARLERVNSYLALVGPATGLAVARWLESWTGVDLSEHGSMPEDAQHALAVARQLLGTTSTCVCGEPGAPGTTHRTDGPCYVAEPTCDCGPPPGGICVHDVAADCLRRAAASDAPAAPPAPADRDAEVEQLRAELDKLIRWHKEDGAQAAKMRTTITRLRAERAELNRQLDCLRGDMRNMETSLREQDAEFERIRRAAGEAAAGAHHPKQADTVLAAAIPEWEAVYEPGNVSDYLIGYANSEAAAKGAAIAWVLSQSDKTADRLEWDPQSWNDRHDAWFDLFERHDDGVDTGVGVTVRHRLHPYTAADFAPEDDETLAVPAAPEETR